MKRITNQLLLGTALAVSLITSATIQAQTYVAITNLYFSEDFSDYTAGEPPAVETAGGRWATVSWTGPEGSIAVVADDQNSFGQGTQNQFFRASSTRNLTMQTPTFFPQDVAIFEFDFIGRYPVGDGARWLQTAIRSGSGWGHITSFRLNNGTIRTNPGDVPKDPSYGGNDKAIRVWTVMNNSGEAILYDRPDGNGTATLPALNASVWLYYYETSTWEHTLPNYIYGRASAIDGVALDNMRLLLDSNIALRSFDMDNVKIYGSRELLPPVQVAITNLLFKDDFNSYTLGELPATASNGGEWSTATWAGTSGTAAIVEDVNNVFGLGEANRYYQLSNTHNVFLTTPVFQKQEVITYTFDFVGHYYPLDGVRWMNVDARNATGAAHVTSLTMSSTGIRGSSASYGPNDSLVRVITVLNNRQGSIIYDRPDDAGTTTLGPGKASIWIYTIYGWEQVVPEFIFARAADFSFGEEIDRVRFYLDSNVDFRSLDLDNFEVYGSIKPVTPPAALLAEVVDQKIRLRWMGLLGTIYQVQYRTDLNSGDWLNVGDPIVAAFDGEQTFEEDITGDKRFYRLSQSDQ